MKKNLPAIFSLMLICCMLQCLFSANVFSKEEGSFNAVSLCKQAKVTMAQAEEAALKEVPGKVRRIELEKDDGVLIYEIIICQGRTKKEVRVDAKSGSIIEIDKKLGKCTDSDDD